MSEDLERTLAELGPGYREVVGRLVDAYAPFGEREPWSTRHWPVIWRTAGCLLAASALIMLGVSAITDRRPVCPYAGVKVYTAAYAPDEEALAAIVASQRADGSWANDYLTRQNAAALRGVAGESARIAFKKAARYLRSKGLEPLTEEELRLRGDSAAKDRRSRS